MSARHMIHPRLYRRYTPVLYNAHCTIQQAIETHDPVDGAVVDEWVDLHRAIPCLVAHLPGLGTPDRQEMPKVDRTADDKQLHISLNDVYSGITDGMRAVVAMPENETRIYDINGVNTDSQASVTRLRVEVVSY